MHKKVKQKYDIWLGEIKSNVKCLWQALLMLPIVISSVWIWGVIRVKIQFSCSDVLLCAILLFCYDVLMSFVLTFYRSVTRA